MAVEQFTNDASTTCTASVASGDTTITVASVVAPMPTSPNFRIKLDNEIMLVTAVNTGTKVYTVSRAQEGTTATSHVNGTPVIHILTAASLTTAFARADTTNSGDFVATSIASSGDGAPFSSQSRFVGRMTTTGAPTSGTWTTGDFGFDSNGVLWLCSAGGTPGTWAPTNFVRISRTTVSASTGFNITIPAGFIDIVIRWTGTSNQTSQTEVVFKFNNTSNNYYDSRTESTGSGGALNVFGTLAGASGNFGYLPSTSSGNLGSGIFEIFDVTGSNATIQRYRNHWIRTDGGSTGEQVSAVGGGEWATTSTPVTSIHINPAVGTISGRFDMYGYTL